MSFKLFYYLLEISASCSIKNKHLSKIKLIQHLNLPVVRIILGLIVFVFVLFSCWSKQ